MVKLRQLVPARATCRPTHCSSIMRISLLSVLISCPCFLLLALSGFSSNSISSNSCIASKFAFFDCRDRSALPLPPDAGTHIGLEWRRHFFPIYSFPIHTLEPRMGLDILQPSPTELVPQPAMHVLLEPLSPRISLRIRNRTTPDVPHESRAAHPANTCSPHPRASTAVPA